MTLASPMPEGWTLPRPGRFNSEWFTSGKLLVQTCTACGARQHPPEEVCHACGGMDFTHTELGPRGTVFSYTVVHYPVNRALADAVPYTVVLVALDDDPSIRIVGNVLGVDPGEVRIGMPVTATWLELTDDDGTVQLLEWLPA